MTRKLTATLLALVALTAMLASACSSGGDGQQAAAPDAQQGVASVATEADEAAPSSSNSAATSTDDDASTAGDDGDVAMVQLGGDPSPELIRVVAAAARTANLDSFEFAMEFGVEGLPDQPGVMVITADGAVDSTNERVQMRIDLNAIFDLAPAGTSQDEIQLMRALLGDGIVEFISDGETVYLHWSLFTSLFGAETPWVSFADQGSDALGGGGFNMDQLAGGPASLLAYFSGIASMDDRGPATIRGVATTYYAGTLDLDRSLELADPAEAAELRAQLAALGTGTLGTLPLELWVDDDGLLRRFAMDIDLAQFGDAAAADLGAARISISADLFNFGDAVQITVPSPGEVTELDGSNPFGAGF